MTKTRTALVALIASVSLGAGVAPAAHACGICDPENLIIETISSSNATAPAATTDRGRFWTADGREPLTRIDETWTAADALTY